MILITSANYLPKEFQVEFGKIPPCFLPLGGKRLYEYQVRLFEGQKIILSLPQSFTINDFEREKIKALGICLLFVPDNLLLGESIAYCLNMNLPLNEPLEILHGDTYFSNFTPFALNAPNAKNALGISKAKYNYEWANVDSYNFKICGKKSKNLKDFVLNGYFVLQSPYYLIKALLCANYDFIEALKIYSQTFAFKLLRNDSWLDFGLISSYFHSKSTLFTQRHFNTIAISSDATFICKSSHHTHKIHAEIEWFKSLPKNLRLFVPQIYSNQNKQSYKCEYLYLNTLAEILVFGRLNAYAFRIIFEKIAEFLSKLHSIKPANDFYHTEALAKVSQKLPKRYFANAKYNKKVGVKFPNFNYRQKTQERLSVFAKQRNFDLNKPVKFNGKVAPSLNALLDLLDSLIGTDFTPCFIHGDFCFSNIAFDFRALRLKTFDARGLDFSDKITVYGDERYDYAKLAHSVFGLYDFIIFGFYQCKFMESSAFYEIGFHIEISQNIKEIQQIFLECFKSHFSNSNKIEIVAIMCHLFLSMLPLHCDDIGRQNTLLANAYRIYFELMDETHKATQAHNNLQECNL